MQRTRRPQVETVLALVPLELQVAVMLRAHQVRRWNPFIYYRLQGIIIDMA